MVVSTIKMQDSTPQTQCSNCQTVFEVPQELLESSDTRVRCGECLRIFDALDGLKVDSSDSLGNSSHDGQNSRYNALQDPPLTTETLTNLSRGATNLQDEIASDRSKGEYSDLDVTYSDFDLFSEDADTPYLEYFDETRNPVDLDFDSVELELDQTFSDTLFKHDATVTADLPIKSQSTGSDDNHSEKSPEDHADAADHLGVQPKVGFQEVVQVPDDPIDLSYLNGAAKEESGAHQETSSDIDAQSDTDTESDILSTGAKNRKRGGWKITTLMVTLLALLFAGLFGYRERAKLYNNSIARPVMVAGCKLFGCEVPLQSDLSKLRLLRRNVFSHPTIEDALVINVVFRNEADIDQAYPVLRIKLLDIRGYLLATRDFKPTEYLPDEMESQKQTLGANTSIDISLEINDPGRQAYSHTVEFR